MGTDLAAFACWATGNRTGVQLHIGPSHAEHGEGCPIATEQHRIVAEVDRRLSIAREVEAEVGTNLKRAQALRQAILSKAFAGCGERGE